MLFLRLRTNGSSNSQQCWDLQCIVGRIQPISLCKPCVMRARGPDNVGRAVQTDPTLLRYTSAITEQRKCWELLAEKIDRFQTLLNNIQQGVQTDATCIIQQCWELLANNVASVCTGHKSFLIGTKPSRYVKNYAGLPKLIVSSESLV